MIQHTVGLLHHFTVSSRFSASDLVGLIAGMSLTWGAGALLGPLLAGAAIEAMPHGLALFVACACLLFMAAALRLRISPPTA